MICKKCGSENHETAKFCRNCGNQLQQKDTTNVPLNQNKQNYKKKTGKKWGVLLVLTVVIAGVIAGFWITKNKNEKKIKEYKNQIAQGNKYVEDLDYEKAEESYLKAIKIDPKRKKPYLKLADIYVAQEKYDKAVKILEDASKNVTVTEKKGEDKQNISEVKQEIETKKEEISNASEYTWVVKPEIEADDIYYLRGKDEFSHSENEMQKQLLNRYAVIKTGDTYGLIGMDGKWYKDLKCTEVGVVLDYYNLKTKDSIYSTEYETETNDFYVDENDELKETVAMYGSDYGMQGTYYYYNNTLHNSMIITSKEQIIPAKLNRLTTAIPIRQSSTEYSGEIYETGNGQTAGITKWLDDTKSKYAIWNGEKLQTDFIYDECGSENSDLLAVKKDGKWGYVNAKGKIVIPLKYDASWSDYSPTGMMDGTYHVIKDYCYAASEGYVVLVKNGKWEIRSTDNKPVILPGIFEKILPAYEGKCWVKKNGKWGVIELNKIGKENNKTEKTNNPDETSKSAEELEAAVRNATSMDIVNITTADFDADGKNEAFALAAEGQEDTQWGWGYPTAEIWFINSSGECSCLKKDVNLSMNALITAGDKTIFNVEKQEAQTSSVSYLYGVKNGQAYELNISGQYMGFNFNKDTGKYIAMNSYYSNSGHQYDEIYVAYSKDTGEFYEITN